MSTQLSERDGEGHLNLSAADLGAGSVGTSEIADGTVAPADLDLTAAYAWTGAHIFGVDDTGVDVTMFGATAGQKVFWDESADTLNLDCTTQCDGTLTVGVDDTGYDVQLFGATAGMHLLWDESVNRLKLVGGAGFTQDAVTLTANTDSGAGSTIVAGQKNVAVTGVTADANDWIVLPTIGDVPIGHSITVACNASSNFEVRTPASSNNTINGVDSDGTQEYLATDTDVIVFTKATATGWIGVSYTSAGAVRTAVVPD